MLIYDNIISGINKSGGVSVGGISLLFQELQSRLKTHLFEFTVIDYEKNENISKKRIFERYRGCRISPNLQSSENIFHSTYYRTPSKGSKVKVVTTVHDFTYENAVKGIRQKVHSLQKNHAIRNSDKIICVSENTKKDLLYYLPKIPASNVHVVYNGVSSGFFPLNVKCTGRSILFVGRRSRFKNFPAVVHALSMLPGVHIECVGGGKLGVDEIALLEREIPGRYKHHYYMTEAELNIAYNRAICLVYPSLHEGFGIPIVEAMRAGCPVIATNASSIPEVAGKAAILMEDADSDEIKAAIENMLVTSCRDELIKLGLEQAKLFSWDRTFDETLKVYEELAEVTKRVLHAPSSMSVAPSNVG